MQVWSSGRSINKVEIDGVVRLDLTQDTVTPATLAKGKTAHDSSGTVIIGTMEAGSSKEEQEKSISITANGTYTIEPDAGKTLSKATAIVNVPTSGGGDSALLSIIDRSISGVYVNSDITVVGVYAFFRCLNLTGVVFQNATDIQQYAFQDCKSLERIDFSQLQKSYASSFRGDTGLRTIILRNSEVAPTTAGSGFSGLLSAIDSMYLYVPSALVDSYKTSSYWGDYKNKIRAIEDYPDITGV